MPPLPRNVYRERSGSNAGSRRVPAMRHGVKRGSFRMKAIVISIGTELTTGQTVDTNSAFLARHLAEHGIATVEHITVADELGEITAAIATAAGRVELVIVTGGLGPTADDLTRQALADAMGGKLVMDNDCLREIEEFFRARGRTMH